MQAIDYLIIGQGLAGSCLALEFLKRNISFLVIDKTNANSASRVAGGLFNPVTGKTMEPTWRAAELFPFLIDFYQQAEQLTQKKFLHPLPVYRPFLSGNEQQQWLKAPHPFVTKAHNQSQYGCDVNDSFGGLELNHCGFLNTQNFIAAVRQVLEQSNRLADEQFLWENFNPATNQYKNIRFSQAIFCEGVATNQNPYFSWLPVKKLKGETLTVQVDLPEHVIFNRGVFAVPTAKPGQFLVGSTYSHDHEPGNTEKGVHELTIKAKALFKKEFTVLSKNWGFRPTSPDRRPMLGHHPEYKNLLVFNGLGTKGVSLAPFFAVQLARHLQGESELELATNIERFYSLYFQFGQKTKA